MADIELVIKIDEEDYKIMKHNIAVNNPLCPLSEEKMVSKVANGIPLPKGHGKLIDESQITEVYIRTTEERYVNEVTVPRIEIIITNAPTIIKADTEKWGIRNDKW